METGVPNQIIGVNSTGIITRMTMEHTILMIEENAEWFRE
jgi:hypothetical protein